MSYENVSSAELRKNMQDHKVIGYVAALPRHQFFADNGALLVTGDELTLKACIITRFKRPSAPERYQYRKTRYKDLEQLLARGFTLVLDRTAFGRFVEVAAESGKKFKLPNFDDNGKFTFDGVEVVRIRPNPAKLKKDEPPQQKTLLRPPKPAPPDAK